MQEKLQIGWRSPIIFILMIIMMAALFFSRAVLSAGIIAFTTVSIFHPDLKRHILHFFASPLLWGMSLLFILPLVSGLWSEDKKEWLEIIRVKLPLLILPFAFAGPIHFSKKYWEWLATIFIALITVATIWSMFQYLSDVSAINTSYLSAKSIVTPLENDHVRFSWLVSAGILMAGGLVFQNWKEHKLIYYLLALFAAWLIVYLHILAARTGLFSFYIIMLGLAIGLIVKKVKQQYGLALLFLLFLLPIVAYKIVPTFQNRVKYFLYDSGYFKKSNYRPQSTDAVRVISLKAGWNVMQNNPVAGVGFGDVMINTKDWYEKNYDEMIESDKIYPSSEWIMYGAGCGWPGILLFSFVMMIPFWVKTGNRFLWWLMNATAAFSFLFDIGLEVQFGVFIYSFIILCCWKWLTPEKM